MSLSRRAFGRQVAELLAKPDGLVAKVVLVHPRMNQPNLLGETETDIKGFVEDLLEKAIHDILFQEHVEQIWLSVAKEVFFLDHRMDCVNVQVHGTIAC